MSAFVSFFIATFAGLFILLAIAVVWETITPEPNRLGDLAERIREQANRAPNMRECAILHEIASIVLLLGSQETMPEALDKLEEIRKATREL